MKLLLFGTIVLVMFLKEPGSHLNYQKDNSSSNSLDGDLSFRAIIAG